MRRAGISLVELTVAGVVLLVVLAVAFSALQGRGLAAMGVGRLDALQELRLAQQRLGRELGEATGVVYPPAAGVGPARALVFTDRTNLLRVVFLDPEGKLRMRSLPDPRAGGRRAVDEVLGQGLAGLAVRQPLRDQIECVLSATGGADSGPQALSVVVAAQAGNQYYRGNPGEGVAP